jgi:hypothetical protein
MPGRNPYTLAGFRPGQPINCYVTLHQNFRKEHAESPVSRRVEL